MRWVALTLLWAAALSAGPFREIEGTYDYFRARHVCEEKLGPGWRVPEIWELFALRGETGRFGEGKRYWSGNTLGEARVVKMVRHESEYFVMNREIPAFAFFLQDGDITPTPKHVKAHVICTRGPKTMPSSKGFERLKDGSVVDRRSDILWEPLGDKKRRNLKLTHIRAQEWCEARGMRLPTLDELYAIVDYNRVKPAVDTAIFGRMHNKYYWSDDDFGDEAAYVVGFAIGSVATSDRKNRSYFRCVKDLEE
ncbi:DUF1566 domain-containing protein [Hydrogenimonas sp. SS33]|uniref:Lcl C-terminal domain-containing protein n=1 Tax=Hydrogenimonas leucolamina TaxID=2954236 RepID=UPI00336BD57D